MWDVLFARIKAVYDGRAALPPLDARLTDVVYRRFARHGAALGKQEKVRLGEINQRLASRHAADHTCVLRFTFMLARSRLLPA